MASRRSVHTTAGPSSAPPVPCHGACACTAPLPPSPFRSTPFSLPASSPHHPNSSSALPAIAFFHTPVSIEIAPIPVAWSTSPATSSGAEGAVVSVTTTAAVAFLLSRRRRRQWAKRWHVNSRPGRAANRTAMRIAAAGALARDYFGLGDEPEHATTKRFEQQWRVPRVVYERLRQELVKDPHFHKTSTDAAGQSCSTDQKMCAALLQLVEGTYARAVWNYLKIGTSTASEALEQVCRMVVKHF